MMKSRILRGGMAALAACAALGMVGCAQGGTNLVPVAVAAPAAEAPAPAPAAAPAAAPVSAAPAAAPAVAAPVAAVPAQSIAVYDSRKVLQQSPLPKAMLDAVSLRFGQREKDLNKLFDDLRKDVAKLESPTRPKMSKKAFAAEKAKNRKRGEELAAKRNALLQEAAEFRTQLTRQVNGLLAKALGAAVQKRNPTVVHDIAAGGVSFYMHEIDITADVLESLDAIWKAAGQGFDLQTSLQAR